MNISGLLKDQKGRPWYRQWWPYAVAGMYLLVVLKTMTFSGLEGQQLQKYDKKIIQVSSEEGNFFGTIGLKREGVYLQATYNLYLVEELSQNEVCYTCEQNHVFNRPCGLVDKYNYIGQIEGGGYTSKGLSGLLAPVFCEEFSKPKNLVESNVSWADAVCPGKQTETDAATDKFYFNGVVLFDSYDEIFGLDEFEIFDAQKFTVKDSCHDGTPGSNFEQTDVEKAIELGKSIKSLKLIFEK